MHSDFGLGLFFGVSTHEKLPEKHSLQTVAICSTKNRISTGLTHLIKCLIALWGSASLLCLKRKEKRNAETLEMK